MNEITLKEYLFSIALFVMGMVSLGLVENRPDICRTTVKAQVIAPTFAPKRDLPDTLIGGQHLVEGCACHIGRQAGPTCQMAP